MKKEPNSARATGSCDQTLPKTKILRGKRNFERLFEQSTVLRSQNVHFRYRIYSQPDEGCLVGFIAKKKLGNAVTRNRIKRLLREVYRKYQCRLTDLFELKTIGFHGVLIAQSPDISYDILEDEIPSLLIKARNHIERTLQSTANPINRKN